MPVNIHPETDELLDPGFEEKNLDTFDLLKSCTGWGLENVNLPSYNWVSTSLNI